MIVCVCVCRLQSLVLCCVNGLAREGDVSVCVTLCNFPLPLPTVVLKTLCVAYAGIALNTPSRAPSCRAVPCPATVRRQGACCRYYACIQGFLQAENVLALLT